MLDAKDYSKLKTQIGSLLRPGEQHKRGLLLDSMYAFLPKDPEAKVLVFTAENSLPHSAARDCQRS
jgi:hypothetical protein